MTWYYWLGAFAAYIALAVLIGKIMSLGNDGELS